MDALDATEEDKKIALYISLIYDLGLVAFDESIMKKKKKLQEADVRMLKVHPFNTINLIDTFEISDDVRNIILHHHERFDGTGYPDQLQGQAIPFVSRILTVVDAYCAMISKRPYRKAFSNLEALEEMKKGAGSVYDPDVVNALAQVLSTA
jgi:HD-GYP domain-containing protein (c-di-GMP phosphodiesterase class II)